MESSPHPYRKRPPTGASAEVAFAHYMPGPPPPTSSTTEGCWLWTGPVGQDGYPSITVQRRIWRASHLSHLLHGGEPLPDGWVMRHTCDHPICVHPFHLIPGTVAQNVADRVARGRSARGERGGTALLTEPQVREIRAALAAGEVQRVIAARYGVSRSAIALIAMGRNWAHVV